VHTQAHTDAHAHARTHTHTHTHTLIYTHTHNTHTHLHTCTRTHTHAHTHARTHARIYTHTHMHLFKAHTHTHTHTRRRLSEVWQGSARTIGGKRRGKAGAQEEDIGRRTEEARAEAGAFFRDHEFGLSAQSSHANTRTHMHKHAQTPARARAHTCVLTHLFTHRSMSHGRYRRENSSSMSRSRCVFGALGSTKHCFASQSMRKRMHSLS